MSQFKTLIAGIELTIGSSTDADIQLDDPSISPLHLTIAELKESRFLLTDAGSANGSFVNGLRIESTIVGINDIVQIGFRPIEVRWLARYFRQSTMLSKPALAP